MAIPCTGPERATSTVAELSAALFALEFGAELAEQFVSAGFSAPQTLSILSDCEHVTKILSGELQSYKFRRLWSEVDDARERLDGSGVAVRAVQEPRMRATLGTRRRTGWRTSVSALLQGPAQNATAVHQMPPQQLLPGRAILTPPPSSPEHVCAEHIYDLEPAAFECDLCNHSFLTYGLLAQHLKANHPESSSSEEEDDADDERENERDTEEVDEEDSDGESDVECPFCGYTYYAEDIEEHIRLEHAEETEEDVDDSVYECSGCGGRFAGRHALALHVQYAHDGESSESDVTSEVTSDSDDDTTDDESDSDLTDSSEDESDGSYPTNFLYECCFCDHHSSSMKALVHHWGYEHGVEIENDVLQCMECPLYFPGHYFLSRHCKSWHDIEL